MPGAVTSGRLGALAQQRFPAILRGQQKGTDTYSLKDVDLPPKVSLGAGLELQDFEMGSVLGSGSFGQVSLATHKATGRVCAIKMMGKAAILKGGQVEHVKQEKAMLQATNHPMIVQMYGSWQDDKHLYIVLEYVPGGELFTLLRTNRRFEAPIGASQLRFIATDRFPEELARFYAAEVVLALAYMHEKGIAYRDLKPENIVIDAKGHIKLTDLGFAKKIDKRTYTLCGTPDYLAPEIILNKGHSTAVDYWSLGVLLFEMVAGYPPFYDDDQMVTYKSIIAQQYSLPEYFTSALKDLLRKLLQVDLSKRLGNLAGGVQDICSHPWFNSVDWRALLQRTKAAPIKPRIKSETDTSHFEPCEGDGKPDRAQPLTVAQQSKFVGF